MTDLFDATLRQQIADLEAIEAANERSQQSNRDTQADANELAHVRSEQKADDLAGRTIGPWTVVGFKKNKHGRNVYVLRHRDGFLKGVRGYELNAMLTAAHRDGVAVR